ncbi:hypothetical protein [Thiocystis violacea]|uniref:hypothetical protein n=1 Tax=Thiocystis violacea TaxID=13725 RepID=UPI001906F4EA|nr:hypothetical protein [Thiocystis violacea]MBK1722881.1 hypothetical protein [Thiocystis violacea]
MASLKNLESGDLAERRYVAKRYVYLESEEDVQILAERWFNDRGAKVEFLAAGDDLGGGCNRVIAQVDKDVENGIDAVGILDRDSLAARSHWDAFFDTADASCSNRSPFGDRIYVLRCWEIENYLLHPLVVESFLADEQGRGKREEEDVNRELFDILCDLLPLVAGSLLLTSYGLRKLDMGHGLNQTFLVNHAQVAQQIETRLSPEAAESLDICIERIVSFGGAHHDRSTTHWLDLIRGIDGKRFLVWLIHHYQLGKARDIRFHLARLTRDCGVLNAVLDDFFFQLISP